MVNLILFWILVIFGSVVSLYNWIILFKVYIINSKTSSFIPLLGGGAIAFAMNLPEIGMGDYELIPLLLDYGCIPLFVHTVFFWIYKGLRGSKSKNSK